MPERLTCCVCGGEHHPDDCVRARRYIAECSNMRISLPPEPDRPTEERLDYDYICMVLRAAVNEIDAADAAHAYRHHQAKWNDRR